MWGKGLRGGNRGYVFLVSLGFAILLGMGGLLAVGRTIEEVQSAGQQLRDMRTFFRADGGAALCLRELRNRLQRDLAAQLRTLTDINAVGSYLDDPAGFLATYAYQGGSSFGGAWQRISASEARLTPSYTSAGAAGSYSCTLSAISRGAPVNQGAPMSPVYLFRYRYAIDSSATDGGITRQVNLQGIFSVRVQLDNFARYALFTNRQRNVGGSQVWFTNRTKFSGPVHTNGEFNFAMNPGAAFTGAVTSVSTTADYYNGGSPVHINGNRNGTQDVPTFGEGFERGVPNIPMPSTTTADRQSEAALGLPAGASTAGYGPGVHLGTAGGAMTGGIYIKGNASMTMTAGTNTSTYSITQGSTVTTVTANYSSNQTTIRIGSGSPTTYSGLPNGMVFTDGSLTGLSGTVQKDSQVTVAAAGDVQITNNITYQDYTPGASPSAEGTINVLGILSWTGDVRIGTTALSDITIHATIMTPNGEFRVDDYDTGSFRGTATILGGVIENTYGAFGTFSQRGRDTGYGRNFVYDTRMGKGMAPPFFPTIGNVVSVLSGVNDRPNWRQTN